MDIPLDEVRRGARLLVGDDDLEVVDDLEVETSSECSPSGIYSLDNAWEHARHRLGLLEQCFDPRTQARFDQLGVGPGWRCLEVGAGGGSITAWLCARVAPGGEVVAVDLDTRFVEELEAPNLEVHRLDVATDDLPPGAFDLIHTRAVLMHIPARDMVIDKLMAGLRPGGWLLLEEYDDFPLAARPDSAYAEVWGMYRAGFAAHGYAMGWARCLPERLAGSGLVEVGHHCEVPFFPGGSPMAQLMQLTFAQAEEQALAGGATEGLLKEANTLLDDAGEWFPCFALVSAWGRRGC